MRKMDHYVTTFCIAQRPGALQRKFLHKARFSDFKPANKKWNKCLPEKGETEKLLSAKLPGEALLAECMWAKTAQSYRSTVNNHPATE